MEALLAEGGASEEVSFPGWHFSESTMVGAAWGIGSGWSVAFCELGKWDAASDGD